jgi:hypothetical protein
VHTAALISHLPKVSTAACMCCWLQTSSLLSVSCAAHHPPMVRKVVKASRHLTVCCCVY